MTENHLIFDTHCDVLYKMYLDDKLKFKNSADLDLTYEGMQHANYVVQCFAVFLPEDLTSPNMAHIKAYIDIYERQVLTEEKIVPIRNREDLLHLKKGQEIGAMLSLEGVDALQGNIANLKAVYDLGIRSVGITWNYANWAADGVLEPRNAGLSLKGREFIAACNKLGMIIDISHLSEAGFWDVMALSTKPVIASHANVYDLCPHPRNLRKSQIDALLKNGGLMGIAFVPDFIREGGQSVGIHDVLKHIEALCELGYSNQIGLGSDFDGIDHHIFGLENAHHMTHLSEALYRHYPDHVAEGILWRNWYRFYENNLPSSKQDLK